MAVDVLRRGVGGRPELARERLALLREMLRPGADPNLSRIPPSIPTTHDHP